MLNNNALHGRRFGNGVYLAEDLRKSLSLALSCRKGTLQLSMFGTLVFRQVLIKSFAGTFLWGINGTKWSCNKGIVLLPKKLFRKDYDRLIEIMHRK